MAQRDPDWFKLRAGKFTGSRFADLMARTKTGPAAARKNLIVTLAVERITGDCVETYCNGAMQRGIDLEPLARQAYELEHMVVVQEVDFIQHPTLPFVGCSPDGLVGDDGMVEIKCPSAAGKHYDALMSGAHAVEYSWQLQGQLWVAGRAWVDAVSYDPRFPEGLQLAICRVVRDAERIKELEAACIAADAEVAAAVESLRKLAAPGFVRARVVAA